MQIQISRCLDKRYKGINNNFPICLRLYHNRKYDYVQTGVFATQQEYEQLHCIKLSNSHKQVVKKIMHVENLIKDFLKSKLYNIREIRALINDDEVKGNEVKLEVIAPVLVADKLLDDVFYWFTIKVAELYKHNQFGNAECYTSTKNVLQYYLKENSLSFNFFTIEKMKELETSLMIDLHLEIATIGKHARNLRAIFNLAIEKKVITRDIYPFGRYRYVIPEVTKAKKSLSRTVLSDLMNYSPASNKEKGAIAYFIFSYFGNGMNLKDMAHLKYRNCKGIVISYYRKKTRNTSKQLKIIKVIITDEMQGIIEKFGNTPENPDSYIFPIITPDMNAKTMDSRVHTKNKSINTTLDIISKKLSLKEVITLGMARHTFANALKQEGVSINFIQECLGHGSAATTEHYMSSFEDVIFKEHICKLKNYFKK